MRNLLSRRETPEESPHVRLEAVWYVEADWTYSVSRKYSPEDNTLIAIRTLTSSGSISMFSGIEYELGPNSLIMFDAGEIAGYAASHDGWQFYWFEFVVRGKRPERIGEVMEIHMSAQERIELERCFISLGSGNAQECALADMLFGYLLADWQLRATDVGAEGMSPQDIVALLEKGRRERITIAELAREAGMCERSFRDAARMATGLAPKAYMLKGEMTAAMELLRTSNMSVSEISACFNYSSPFYFSRVFKKYYGVSPQHVRDGIEL